ncbi:MAG: hypothetical protein ACR2QF_15970 [Geminicoccaceae bacterium]
MKLIAATCLAAALSGCGYNSFGQPDISSNQRLLIVCEAWNSVFTRIDNRDQFSLASETEIEAVNNALPVLNPICTSNLSTASGFDIHTLEAALLAVLASQEEQS